MFSLLGDLGSWESPFTSGLLSLSPSLPPYFASALFSLLVFTVLNFAHRAPLPNVTKAIRTLRKGTSELHPHHPPPVPRLAAASVAKASQTEKKWIPQNIHYPAELLVWHIVDEELDNLKSTHHRFWWSKHFGKHLAVLLHAAEYPENLQYRDLKFFATTIAPYLGVSRETNQGGPLPWPSFMTDDGTPLEVSWDWGTKDGPPMIRYSIEPIGLYAGSSLDPGNLIAAPAFQEQLLHSLGNMRLEWFQHFKAFFDVRNEGAGFVEDTKDHNTSIFYAFDLSPNEITAKVYFFPKIRARATGQSSIEVLSQAIRAAPHSTSDVLKAWDMFCDFSTDPSGPALEHEMLAIDLIDPLESRLKIYFRCRDTTFNSVVNIMTIGGRIENPKLYQGLEDLRHLWNVLFHTGVDVPPEQSLPRVDHRTAGILYNIEFKLGDTYPVAKIYLPVRHYSSSDEAVIQGLNLYFQHHQRGKYMPSYVKAMRALFCTKSMQATSGIHTYIGCAIRPNGTLRVVSYFKPGIPQFVARTK
ncbi:tryptophan dimethylallyltransferase-domain-containing protein [Nemania sp. NC0429]|nr:tryptophan dimethylallyltransferase-domain-containing protein [Nemania sp. NC0429]